MNLKLKKIMSVVLCIIFSMALLCGCKKENVDTTENANENTSENTTGKNENNKEEYVARIKAYKEYYEGIESDYSSVNGAILVHEDGMPYIVLCCTTGEKKESYKVKIIDYKDGNVVLTGEKDFFYDEDAKIFVYVAFLDERCIINMDVMDSNVSEYWEFESGNHIAKQLNKIEDEIRALMYVCDISKNPYEYLYSYREMPFADVYIYDEKSDISTVNKMVTLKLHDYMKLSDEQKEYFEYPIPSVNGREPLMTNFVNIYNISAWVGISENGMSNVEFKQCLNELIEEPIYRIEDLLAKEYVFISEDGKAVAEKRKELELKNIEERMPKYNPYSTDKELLETYYNGVKNALGDWLVAEKSYDCKDKDLATIMAMDNEFAKELKKYLTEDYVFTSEELKGATWKDIVYSGGVQYPILTVTKNGNTLSVPVIDDPKMKEAIDAYLAYGCADWFWIEFAYIDDDEYPELIRRYMDPQWEIYTYKNGTVTELICDGISSFEWTLKEYQARENKIILNKGDVHMELCIQGDKLVPTNNNQSNNADDEINKALEAYAAEAVGEHYGIAFVYIDEDDIPEMMVLKCESDSLRYTYSVIYSYKNGKITEYTKGWSIYKYIPKADRFIENEEYQAFWEEDGEEYWNTDWREVIGSMKGAVNENIPSDMFESIEYSDDFEKAKEKIQK